MCHCAQFCLTHCAKTVNITDETFFFRKTTCKRLTNKVFKRIQKFAALTSQQRRICAFKVQRAATLSLRCFCMKVEPNMAEDIIKKLLGFANKSRNSPKFS